MAEHLDLIERRMRAVEPHAPDILDVHRRLERRRRTQRIRAGTLAIAIVAITIAALANVLPLGSTPVDDTVPTAPPFGRLIDIDTGAERPFPAAFASFVAAKNFQMSPDGTLVAFTSLGEVYVAEPDGSGAREVTGGSLLGWRPTWSGDSSRLVFTGRDDAHGTAIYAHDLRTDETSRVVAVGRWLAAFPSLSADGSTILYTALIDGTFGLFTVPSAGGQPDLLVAGAAYGSFAPVANRIVYVDASYHRTGRDLHVGSGLVIADEDGGRPAQVGPRVRGWPGVTGMRWEFLHPVWSPDGTRLAYAPLEPSTPSSGVRLVVMEVSTGGTTSVATGYWPTWFDNDTLAIQTRR